MEEQRIDTGLACLIQIAKYYNIPAEYRQLERAYVLEPEKSIDTVTIVRAARDLKLKAKAYQNVPPEELYKLVYPLILRMNDGNSIVLTTIRDQKLYILDPRFSMTPQQADANKLFENWTGEIVLFTRRYELPQKFQQFSFRWFFPVVSKYLPFLRNVFGLSFLMLLLGLAGPFFTMNIIDKVLSHRVSDALTTFLAGMFLSSLFSSWMGALRTYLFANITTKMDVALSSRLFARVTALPVKYFAKWQVGDVVSRVRELETLRSFLTGSSLTIIIDIIFATLYLLVLFLFSGTLLAIVVLTIPLFILLNLIATPIFRRLINDRFLIGAESNSFLIETLTGIGTVKATSVEQNFISRYEEVLARLVKSNLSVINLANVTSTIGQFIRSTFELMILWVGAYLVMESEISIGELIAFRMISGQLIGPIMRLVGQWQHFQRVHVSMDRLGDIMNEEGEPAFNPSRTTLPSLQGSIALDHMSFSYSEEYGRVLDNINIKIPAGKKIGIVGRSGSGKSTLTKLIQRLYLPDQGKILIDGVDIAQVEPAWLRRQIGVVLQDSMLFAGTIAENIKIACPNATMNDVVAAAKLAGADEFIQGLAHGYETFVGERGSLLSGGQRQRIAIARALISDPRILIFDEATSALDYESEKIIMDNIEPISKGRTMLMIAHRLSTVRDCDAIIVIEKGRIVEAGSHEDLLKRDGIYRKLHEAQAG